MSSKVKIAIYMLIFIVSVIVLTSKFLYPPTVQVIVQGDTTYVQEVPNVYTLYDCMLMVLASFSLCLSTTLIYFTVRDLELSEKNTVNKIDLSDLNEHIGKIVSSKVEDKINGNTDDIQNFEVGNDLKTTENEEKLRMENFIKILKGNEKTIVKILMDHGEMTQSELFERTKIPKSTLSRTLSDLEIRGIVLRYEHGISKKVKLNKL
ncbi:putative transcriptional regulator [Methanococcus maripaludis]|uniref:Putative transcriptional regulator n=1 Tax=Methanococcus maripaludis TaxID=39152 RepID=A0A7J9P0Y1_METMI|nr:MarR family transcriptional regulator [Methanococcus maripaludis]MBA2853599.1 putative transcriptional regulator [Methanococcus maripaludis]